MLSPANIYLQISMAGTVLWLGDGKVIVTGSFSVQIDKGNPICQTAVSNE